MNNSKLYLQAKEYEEQGDMERAYLYYLEAVLSEDDGEAINALAQLYFDGEYVSESYDKAGAYFGKAYDRGANITDWTLIIAGCCMEKKGKDDPEKLAQAMEYYKKAGDLGCSYGYECLGAIYYDLGDYEKAYEYLSKMNGKNPCGLYYMGRLYDEGHYVKQDMNKAIELYKMAIDSDKNTEDEYGEDGYSMQAKSRLREMGIKW